MVETRRQQIEDAASSLFRERGYSGTSVREIARALDIQGPSLYAHVTSKEDVLWSIVRRASERFEAEIAPLASLPEPAAERLRRICRAHVRVVTSNREHATVFLHEWRFLGARRRTEALQLRDRYETYFRSVIADGIRTGEFARVDVALASSAILSALNGVSQWYRDDGRLSSDAIASEYADLFAHALACRDEKTSDEATGRDANPSREASKSRVPKTGRRNRRSHR